MSTYLHKHGANKEMPEDESSLFPFPLKAFWSKKSE
jgi:hypothetical protein